MSKTWSVIIAVLITAVVGVGGSYYYLYTKASEEKAALQERIEELREQVVVLQSKSSTAETEEAETVEDGAFAEQSVEEGATDWLTYTNSEYEFSFKYPSDFKVTPNEGLPGGPDLLINPTAQSFKVDNSSVSLMSLSWHQNIGEATTLASFASSISAKSKTNSKVGKYSAVWVKNIDGSNTDQVIFEVNGTISSFFSRAGMLLTEGKINSSQAQEYSNVFESIIQSFEYKI